MHPAVIVILAVFGLILICKALVSDSRDAIRIPTPVSPR